MNTEEKIREILFELSGMEITDNNASLQEDLALDSLAMVMLLIEIEEAFGIELDESDMNPFELNTVQDVIVLVSKYLGDENEQTS
ncbi:MAG: acyl carrier protein [Ruminococcaceae bacterium]|nr:acyl carrier protein [Oscillospiraceae bacterium]